MRERKRAIKKEKKEIEIEEKREILSGKYYGQLHKQPRCVNRLSNNVFFSRKSDIIILEV